MPSIVAFPLTTAQPAPRVNPHQPETWQRAQHAAIVALAAAEDTLANIGVPREQARVIARASVRTFLQNMAMSRAEMAPMMRVHGVVEEFLLVCEHAHKQSNGAAS